MRMLLKTTSKQLPQHMGKHLAPTDQLVTPGKRLSMSAKPPALPIINRQGMETFETLLSKKEAPIIHPQVEAVMIWRGAARIKHEIRNVLRWLA